MGKPPLPFRGRDTLLMRQGCTVKQTGSNRSVRWGVALVVAVFLLAPARIQAAESRQRLKDNDRNSTRATFVALMAERLLQFQLADGAMAYHAPKPGAALRIVPYFANLAALGWIEAARLVPSDPRREAWLAATRKWMGWYAGHLNRDGSIDDYRGPMDGLKATGSYDSTDSYAATFGLLAWRYLELTGDLATIRTLAPALKQAHAAIELTRDSDGLTYATPLYGFKYLMDNCEVAIGLAAMQRIFKALGEPREVDACAAQIEQLRHAFASFYCAKMGVFGYALDAFPLPLCGFKEPYPDAMANLMVLTWLSSGDAQSSALFDRLWQEFWLKNPDSRGFPLWWTWAAQVCGRGEARAQAMAVLRQMTEKPDTDCVLIGMAAVATATGVDALRFPELRLNWDQLTVGKPLTDLGDGTQWPQATRAVLTGHKLSSQLSHNGKWNQPWAGKYELPYEFTANEAYAQLNLVFPGTADLRKCRAILIDAGNVSKDNVPRGLELTLVEADGDWWITSASGAMRTAGKALVALSDLKLSKWSKSGDGKPNMSRMVGLRLTLVSEGKTGAGVLSIRELGIVN